jgi:hypothetical protein
MKKVAWFVQLVLFSAVIFLSSDASAACPVDEDGNCIKIVVTGGGEDSGGGGLVGGGLVGCGSACGGGAGAAESRAESIVKRILKNSCVKTKSGEDCGAFGVRLEGQCFLETGLTQVSRFCANFGNDAAIACSNGQIPSCP